jgi:hypothetical protein
MSSRSEIVTEYYASCDNVVEMEKSGEITGDQARDMIRQLHERKTERLAALVAARAVNTVVEDGEDGETLGSDDSDSDYVTESEYDSEDDDSFIVDEDDDEDDYTTEEETEDEEEDD